MFLPCFFPKGKTELEFRFFCSLNGMNAAFMREEEIVKAVGYGIVEEGGHAEESF